MIRGMKFRFLIIKTIRKFPPENHRICIDERQCWRLELETLKLPGDLCARQASAAKKGSNKNNDMPMVASKLSVRLLDVWDAGLTTRVWCCQSEDPPAEMARIYPRYAKIGGPRSVARRRCDSTSG